MRLLALPFHSLLSSLGDLGLEWHHTRSLARVHSRRLGRGARHHSSPRCSRAGPGRGVPAGLPEARSGHHHAGGQVAREEREKAKMTFVNVVWHCSFFFFFFSRAPMGLRKDLHIAEILKNPEVAQRFLFFFFSFAFLLSFQSSLVCV